MDFLSLIGAIPGLMDAFSGSESAPYRKQQEQIAQRQNQLSQAMTDVNNPLYQQIYGQYKQQNASNLAQTIAEAQGQNRMNTALGRTPLFSQERGGENIFRNLVMQQQNAGVQADTQTRQALQQAMGGNNAAQNQYNSITQSTGRANAQQLSGYQGIEQLLRGMVGGTSNQGGQSPYQQPQLGQNIQWNTPRGSYGY